MGIISQYHANEMHFWKPTRSSYYDKRTHRTLYTHKPGVKRIVKAPFTWQISIFKLIHSSDGIAQLRVDNSCPIWTWWARATPTIDLAWWSWERFFSCRFSTWRKFNYGHVLSKITIISQCRDRIRRLDMARIKMYRRFRFFCGLPGCDCWMVDDVVELSGFGNGFFLGAVITMVVGCGYGLGFEIQSFDRFSKCGIQIERV